MSLKVHFYIHFYIFVWCFLGFFVIGGGWGDWFKLSGGVTPFSREKNKLLPLSLSIKKKIPITTFP